MNVDITPRRAAVLLCRELTRATDDKSKKVIRLLLSDIRRSMGQVIDLDEPAGVSSLGRRILKVLDGQRLKAKTIARLCGLSYTGTVRGELARMVKAGLLVKVSGHYVKKCLSNGKTDEAPIIINAEKP